MVNGFQMFAQTITKHTKLAQTDSIILYQHKKLNTIYEKF